MPDYKTPSWAGWKRKGFNLNLSDDELRRAESEAQWANANNAGIKSDFEKKKMDLIQKSEELWGKGARQVTYLWQQKIEPPPDWFKEFRKLKKAVLAERERLARNERARGYRQNRKRIAEIEEQIVERYGAGWVQQEGE